MNDEIDFVCPHYPPSSTAESMHEYYVIYSVSKTEYENCNIGERTLRNRRSMVINCSQPESDRVRKYTLIFEKFSAFGGFQFEEGMSYYYITTSIGTAEGMDNSHLGACWYHNMKLTLRVLPLTTTTTSTISTPLKNGTNASLSAGQGSGDAFNWTGSGHLWNESDPSPLPPSQTDDDLGQAASTTTTTSSTTTTIRGRPVDQDTTTTPWWWWVTSKPKTEKPPYKPPFEEDKDIIENQIDPRKEGLVDSSSLAVPSLRLVLYTVCLTLLLHRNVVR